MIIYYVFSKLTSEYAGSGTPYFDDEFYGCTEVPAPAYNEYTEIPTWNGNEWDIKAIENI